MNDTAETSPASPRWPFRHGLRRRPRLGRRVRLGLVLALELLALLPAYGAWQAFQSPTVEVRQVPVWGWTHWGGWEPTVFLKPNTLYGVTELGPDRTYYAALVEDLEARFSYTFAADTPARIEGWYEVVTAMSAGDLVNERVLIVPRTPFLVEQGENYQLELPLAVDRDAYRQRLEQVAGETGAPVPRNAEVAYNARVEVTAATDSGQVRESFEAAMTLPLQGDSFTITREGTSQDNGIVRRAETQPLPGVGQRRVTFLAATAVVALLPLVFALVTANRPPDPPLVREARRIMGKYRKRVARSEPPEGGLPGTETVSVASMSDLARVSEELLKPIIYAPPQDGSSEYLYYVVDGATRYEYRLTDTPADAP